MGNVMVARRDYSLNGPETAHAWEQGLVSAEWYKCKIPRELPVVDPVDTDDEEDVHQSIPELRKTDEQQRVAV